jgi:hypothetical protein
LKGLDMFIRPLIFRLKSQGIRNERFKALLFLNSVNVLNNLKSV